RQTLPLRQPKSPADPLESLDGSVRRFPELGATKPIPLEAPEPGRPVPQAFGKDLQHPRRRIRRGMRFRQDSRDLILGGTTALQAAALGHVAGDREHTLALTSHHGAGEIEHRDAAVSANMAEGSRHAGALPQLTGEFRPGKLAVVGVDKVEAVPAD